MKLRRSRNDNWLGGLCGGLAAELGLDAGRLRIVWLVATTILGMFAWFSGVLAALVIYLTFCFVIPMEPEPEPKFEAPPLQPWKGAALKVLRFNRKKCRSISEL